MSSGWPILILDHSISQAGRGCRHRGKATGWCVKYDSYTLAFTLALLDTFPVESRLVFFSLSACLQGTAHHELATTIG